MAFTKDDTYNKVVHVIAEKIKIPKENITVTTTFKDLGVDSLDQVELIMSFENEFDIRIEDEEGASIQTVQDAVDLLHAKRTR